MESRSTSEQNRISSPLEAGSHRHPAALATRGRESRAACHFQVQQACRPSEHTQPPPSPSSSTAPCCSPPTSPPSTRCAPPWPRRASRPVPIFVASLKDRDSVTFVEQALSRPEPRRHRHLHGLCQRRGTGQRDAVRPRRRAGVPGGDRHDPPRRLGKEPARPGAGRPRHACRHARTRRPHPGRRHLVQGAGRDRRGARLRHHRSTAPNPTSSTRSRPASPPSWR